MDRGAACATDGSAYLRRQRDVVRLRRPADPDPVGRDALPARAARVLARPDEEGPCDGAEHDLHVRVLESPRAEAGAVGLQRQPRRGRIYKDGRRRGPARDPAARSVCVRRVGSGRLSGVAPRRSLDRPSQPRPEVHGRGGQVPEAAWSGSGAAASGPTLDRLGAGRRADHRDPTRERVRLVRQGPRLRGGRARAVQGGGLHRCADVHRRQPRRLRQRRARGSARRDQLRSGQCAEGLCVVEGVPAERPADVGRILGGVVRCVGHATREHERPTAGRRDRVDARAGLLVQPLHVSRRHVVRVHERRQLRPQRLQARRVELRLRLRA